VGSESQSTEKSPTDIQNSSKTLEALIAEDKAQAKIFTFTPVARILKGSSLII